MGSAAALAVTLLAVAIPPLTGAQRARLETAFDGRDHREEAFVALCENAASFPAAGAGEIAGSEPLRLAPPLDAMLEAPDRYRGDLCRITGVIQQRTRLDRPHHEVWEWFVRDDAGRAILVYVEGLDDRDVGTFTDGRRVQLYARFYKRVDAVARDGAPHRYAAFVGARPWLDRAGGPGFGAAGLLVPLAALVVVLLVVFLVLLLLARRSRGARRRRARAGGDAGGVSGGDLDAGAPLPDDPIDALAELKRRADR